MGYNYSTKNKAPIEYGKLITGTFGLVWRHKFLWFFGLFAGGSVSTSGWNCNFGGGNLTGDSSTGNEAGEIADWLSSHLVLAIAIAAAILFTALLLWLWSIVCQGAAISSIRDIIQDRAAGFSLAFHQGIACFPRLLLFNLLLLALILSFFLVVAALILLLVFLSTFIAGASETAVVILGIVIAAMLAGALLASLGYLAIFTFGFTLWLGFTMVIGLISMYAVRAVILAGAKPWPALRQGWWMLWLNLKHSILLFLLSAALGLAGGIAIFTATALAAIPGLIAWVITYLAGFPVAGIAVASLLSLPVLAVMLLAWAANNTYFTAYWTGAYLKLADVVNAAGQPPVDTVNDLPNLGHP